MNMRLRYPMVYKGIIPIRILTLVLIVLITLSALQSERIRTKKAETQPSFSRSVTQTFINKARAEQCQTQYGILINLGRHSGLNRAFLVDLTTGNIVLSGLCCHGGGYGNDSEEVEFSNEPGSHCSSEGFYKIGYRYEGTFGTAYKLHGLSTTNSNAFERFIVFHSHDCVPENEVDYSICESQGCPTLNPEVFKKFASYLDTSEKPVMMWIYSSMEKGF